MSQTSQRIPATLLAGDGIGPEIVHATRRILEALGAPFDWDEQPAGLGLSKEQIDRRWSLLTSQVKDASTMSTTPPTPTGPAPTIPSREEVITRAGAHPGPQGTASASPSPR